MWKFLLRRLAQFPPVLLVVATLTFLMIRLAPGGPFDQEKQTTPEIKAMLAEHYGLDRPLWRQYLDYLGNLVQGDLGPSFKYTNRTVNELIAESFPVSLELGLWSLLIALLIGMALGIGGALKPNSWLDYASSSVALGGVCLPTFVVGPVLVLVFALWLGRFNASGWDFPRDRVLPALTLGLYYSGYVARLTRSGMIEVMRSEFIRTARAKGASAWRVVTGHALRNGLLPVVSFLGPAAAGLVTGSFVVESIFNIPGLGRFFVTSAFNRDYTMVMGTVLFYAALILFLNLVVDIVLALLNPRIRLD